MSSAESHRELVCGVVLLRPDGAVLLQLRDDKPDIRDPGLWVFPGGHIETGETLEQGARREFLEETDYSCGELHRFISINGSSYGYSDDFHLTFFWTLLENRPQPKTCHEGQELRFVRREEISRFSKPLYLEHVWDCALLASGIRAR